MEEEWWRIMINVNCHDSSNDHDGCEDRKEGGREDGREDGREMMEERGWKRSGRER